MNVDAGADHLTVLEQAIHELNLKLKVQDVGIDRLFGTAFASHNRARRAAARLIDRGDVGTLIQALEHDGLRRDWMFGPTRADWGRIWNRDQVRQALADLPRMLQDRVELNNRRLDLVAAHRREFAARMDRAPAPVRGWDHVQDRTRGPGRDR